MVTDMVSPAEQDEIADAINVLVAHGYVVLKERSYRRAQERQRIAEVQRGDADERAVVARRWAENCLAEERRLRDRLTFVWGVAIARGATAEELAADPLTRKEP